MNNPLCLESVKMDGVCRDPRCPVMVKPMSNGPYMGRYFITMGHCGFNSKRNNFYGYDTMASAMAASRRYLYKVQ